MSRFIPPDDEAAQHPWLAHQLSRRLFRAPANEKKQRRLKAVYYGLMSEVDGAIGRVIACLKETGRWDDTLIVFTSDHGEQMGDHWLLGKCGYFDASYRIPLIVRDPAGRAVTDAALMVLVALVTLGVGFATGFRTDAGPERWLAALGLLVIYALPLSGVFVWLGLVSGFATLAAGTVGILYPRDYVPLPFLAGLLWVLMTSVVLTVRASRASREDLMARAVPSAAAAGQ